MPGHVSATPHQRSGAGEVAQEGNVNQLQHHLITLAAVNNPSLHHLLYYHVVCILSSAVERHLP